MRYVLRLGLALMLALIGMGVPLERAVYAQSGSSLRFHGNGVQQIDRVKIAIDGPARPIDVGGDFTIEFWMKAAAEENRSSACSSGEDTWINGNIVIDRDVFNAGDYGDFGISLYGGQIAFGVNNGSSGQTICGATNVADSAWHHIALTRSQSGSMRIFVDGRPDAEGSGPDGDVSYRDGRSTQYPNDPYLVIGAEKHDYNAQDYPSYSGWLDELRISNIVRYAGAFDRPAQPFAPDGNTVGLYHLDEGSGDTVGDSSGAAGGPSNGVRHTGGNPAGPEWSADTPFGATAVPTETPADVVVPPDTPIVPTDTVVAPTLPPSDTAAPVSPTATIETRPTMTEATASATAAPVSPSETATIAPRPTSTPDANAPATEAGPPPATVSTTTGEIATSAPADAVATATPERDESASGGSTSSLVWILAAVGGVVLVGAIWLVRSRSS